MNKLFLISFLFFACSPSKTHQAKRLIVPPAEVAQQIEEKESPLHISDESPAWKPFIFITLLIILGCFFSTRHKYIHKVWNKICSKLDKDK